VKHVVVTLVVVPLVAAAVFGALNWFFRRRGADFSLVASVIAQWLVAYLVWTLAVAVVESFRGVEEERRALYTTYGFAVFAALMGLWQYRLARAGARQQAARVFLWAQMAWLALLLVLAERHPLD
jgi:hypothetical protein